jgi:hypothetical protein
MYSKQQSEKLGLELWLQRPEEQDRQRESDTCDNLQNIVYPELDA